MEDKNFSSKLKQILKVVLKPLKILLIKAAIIALIIIILIAGFAYILDILNGVLNHNDPGNVPAAVADNRSYINFNEDGTFSFDESAEEMWRYLVENDSDVAQYLSGPESLAKMMNAELVTMLPDTRQNVTEPIDWDSIDLESGQIQGIVKFKRRDVNNNESYLTYMSPDDFYGLAEEYNENGTQSARNEIMKHFTIIEQEDNENNSSASREDLLQFSGQDVVTDISEDIVEAALTTPSPGAGWCQLWVHRVYRNAGLGENACASAYIAFQRNCVSTRSDNIPVGACVYGTGTGNYGDAGHVGIYIGNGNVMDNVGSIRTISLQAWMDEQRNYGHEINGRVGYLGWGWQSGAPSAIISEDEDTSFTNENDFNNIEENNNEDEQNNTNQQTNSNSTTHFVVQIAKWNNYSKEVVSDDSEVEGESTSSSSIDIETVDYQQMVKPYALPFNLVWAFVVIGEQETFDLAWTDLVYNSDIEITVHDNYEKYTDVLEEEYTRERLYYGTATVSESNLPRSDQITINDREEEAHKITTTIVNETISLEVALTKADTWLVEYTREYEYSGRDTNTTTDVNDELENIEGREQTVPQTYTNSDIEAKKSELTQLAEEQGYVPNVSTHIDAKTRLNTINRVNTTTNTTETSNYIGSEAEKREKVELTDEEDNFVKMYINPIYSTNRFNVTDCTEWLFEIIESNSDTANWIDNVKFLLYKATGRNYGVTEFDWQTFNEAEMSSVYGSEFVGDSIEERVWFALLSRGYSREAVAGVLGNIYAESGFRAEAIEHGNGIGFGLCQWSFGRRTALENYARSKGKSPSDIDTQIEFLIAELTPGGGANGYAHYQLSNYHGSSASKWKNSRTPEEAAEAFCWSFERPGIPNMGTRKEKARQYYNQLKDKERPSASGGSIIEVAERIHKYMEDHSYSYSLSGSQLKSTFEASKSVRKTCCATYVSWVVQEAGYLPDSEHSNGADTLTSRLKARGWREVSSSDKKAGDLMWYPGEHIEIYAGNNTIYNAGSTNAIQRSNPYPMWRHDAKYLRAPNR